MDWKDDFKQKLADAGVKMFQELQSKLKELEKMEVQSTKSPLDELQSMAKELESLKTQNPDAPKEFTLKQTFTDVSKMSEGENISSLIEYHYNIPWAVGFENWNDYLEVWLLCREETDIPWSVQCSLQVEIIHPSGKTISVEGEHVFESNSRLKSISDIMKWEEMMKEYLDGDQLTVLVNVTINKMTEIS